jgi:hypothetical protein
MTIPDKVAQVNAQAEPGIDPPAFTEEELEQMRQAVAESDQEDRAEAPALRQPAEQYQQHVAATMVVPRLNLVQQLHATLETLAVTSDTTGRLPAIAWEGAEHDPEQQIREAVAEANASITSAYRKILAVAGLLAMKEP